jgi:hypothetical protein
MLRRTFLLATLAPALAADPRQELYYLLGLMASGLSEENPQQFMDAFDRSMKGYAELAANVRALVEQVEVMSTIDLVDDSGDAVHHTVHADWLLQLRNKDDRASMLRRQKTIEVRFEKQKRKWKIVSFQPLDFFAPPRKDQP